MKDIKLLNGIYKFNGSPYDGDAYLKFSNSQRISALFTFSNGIPQKANHYGYGGEIITTSTYEPIELSIRNPYVYRITKIEETEGEFVNCWINIICSSKIKNKSEFLKFILFEYPEIKIDGCTILIDYGEL